MRLNIRSKSAANIAIILIAVRTFFALTIDGHEYLNSGWICALLGCIISIPLALSADKKLLFACSTNNRMAVKKIIVVLFSICTAYESAVISRLLINTVSYSNLQTYPIILLSAIIYAICIYVIVKNGLGIGNASKLWLICMCILFIAIMISCAGDIHLKWITPLFGPGKYHIIEGAIIAAGHIVSGFLLILFSDNDNSKHFYCTRSVIIGGAISCLMCIYWSLMTPVQLSNHMNRLTGIELLLSNGRTSLAVLLPMALIWFMSLIAAMYGYSFSSALFIQTFMEEANHYSAAALTAVVSFLLSNFGAAESNIALILSKYKLAFLILLLSIYWVCCTSKRSVTK